MSREVNICKVTNNSLSQFKWHPCFENYRIVWEQRIIRLCTLRAYRNTGLSCYMSHPKKGETTRYFVVFIRYDSSWNEQVAYLNWNKKLFVTLWILTFLLVFTRTLLLRLVSIVYSKGSRTFFLFTLPIMKEQREQVTYLNRIKKLFITLQILTFLLMFTRTPALFDEYYLL